MNDRNENDWNVDFMLIKLRNIKKFNKIYIFGTVYGVRGKLHDIAL